LRKQIVEKTKDGTLKVVSNGELPKSAPKKRGRWDQTGGDEGPTPVKKKATSNSVSSVGSSWDKEDVRLYLIYNFVRVPVIRFTSLLIGRDQCLAFVNTVMNLWFLWKV
jgi:hypothetical protein